MACLVHPALRPSLDRELELTQQAVAEHDFVHALHHVLAAVGCAPNSDRWISLLAQVRAALPDFSARVDKDPFYAAIAVRARILEESHQYEEAANLLSQVVKAMPHLGFEQWLLHVLKQPNARSREWRISLINALTPAMFASGRIQLFAGEQAAAQRFVAVARTLVRDIPDDWSIRFLASGVMRRAGLAEEARRVVEGSPNANANLLIANGLACRALHDWPAARNAFSAAYALSNDPTHRLELARVESDAGEWQRAADLFAQHPTGDPETDAARAFVNAAAKNNAPPMPFALDRFCRENLGHDDFFQSGDATANILRQIGERSPDEIRSMRPKLGISGFEGPSNRLCLALVAHNSSDPRVAHYESDASMRVLDQPSWLPDRIDLWKVVDGNIVQAIDAATPGAAIASAWILEQTLRLRSEQSPSIATGFLTLWTRAQESAPRADAVTAHDWLHAMLHPLMPVEAVQMGPLWLTMWQSAALVGLAHSESGWSGSERRRALLSVLWGPIDWSMAAAIRVLGELALRDAGAIDEIRQILIDLTYEDVLELPDVLIAQTLHLTLSMIPLVPTSHVAKVFRALTDEPGAANAAPATPSKTASKPWWKFWN